MRDYISVGAAPPDEDCAQIGQPGYRELAIAECKAYIQALRNKLGPEAEGARLTYRGFEHDFGTYYEVICFYDSARPEAEDYAFRCESNGPATWAEGLVEPPRVGMVRPASAAMTYAEFTARFPENTEIGRAVTPKEIVVYRDNGQEVGVWWINRRTTTGEGEVLDAEKADEARAYIKRRGRAR